MVHITTESRNEAENMVDHPGGNDCSCLACQSDADSERRKCLKMCIRDRIKRMMGMRLEDFSRI